MLKSIRADTNAHVRSTTTGVYELINLPWSHVCMPPPYWWINILDASLTIRYPLSDICVSYIPMWRSGRSRTLQSHNFDAYMHADPFSPGTTVRFVGIHISRTAVSIRLTQLSLSSTTGGLYSAGLYTGICGRLYVA
eukprot:24274-Eustigmatos_ZCMA.PRE.1